MKIKERAGSPGLTGVRMSATLQLHPALVQAPLDIWPKALPIRLETKGKEGEGQGGRVDGSPGVRLEALVHSALTQQTPLPLRVVLLHGLVGHPVFVVTGRACRKPNSHHRAVAMH